MKNIAIIPARSGSKGLKDKNIKMLNGKPLLAYTIECAKNSNLFDEIIVSTDSQEYAEIACKWGASVPFLRSEALSSDKASSVDVVNDVITRLEQMGKTYDTLALLQPTSPLRTREDVIGAYKQMNDNNANAVVGVCEVDHSPLWSNVLPDNLSLVGFLNKDIVGVPRQKLPTYYRINGAIYIIRTDYFMSVDDIYKERCYAYLMDKSHSVDIDDEVDFIIAEALMK